MSREPIPNSAVDPEHARNARFPTRSGRVVDLLAPTVDMIDPDDIAWALAHTLRYGGHANKPINVASHSINVHNHILANVHLGFGPAHISNDLQLPLVGLLHDAAEAYLGDVIRPLKLLLAPLYVPLEASFERVIADRFGIDAPVFSHSMIKDADRAVYAWERRDIGPDAWDADRSTAPAMTMPNLSSEDAYHEFLNILSEHGALT